MPAWIVVLTWLLAVQLTAAEEPAPALEHNPFERPVALEKKSEPREQEKKSEPFATELRATMVAGEQSMANVGGTIVRLGEEVNGYRLVEVHERKAVFERNGKRHVLSLD